MPSEQDQRDTAATQFVAALGAAMAAANYPVIMVRAVMEGTSRAYGPENQFLTLPHYVHLLWRAVIQLTCTPDRRAVHD